MEFSYQDLKRLAEMLKTTEEDSDSEDDLPQCGISKLGNIVTVHLSIMHCYSCSYILPEFYQKDC
jgi:hypothetical protein